MANYLDTLIGRIREADLRAALASEVARLREGREFGLVFEHHLPETVRLTSHPVRRGVCVQDRGDATGPIWTVTRVQNGMAQLSRHDGDALIEETRGRDDLVVVRRFGEAIYPGLRSVGRVERGGAKPFHAVISGENYHALETLLYTHEGRVDVIYIDPPYNSGARDWTYNNDYVDQNDQYRHSKWLSFLERRLLLAGRLLKPDGAMVVTIDEHEVSRLGVLLGQVFPTADITLVSIVTNPKGVTRPGVRRFSRVGEYAYFCFFGDAGIGSFGDDLLTMGADEIERHDAAVEGQARPRWKGLLRSGDASRREDRKDMFYPVLIDVERRAVLGAGKPLPFDLAPDFATLIDGLTPVWPVRSDGSLGRWGVGPDTLRSLIGNGYVSLGEHQKKRNTWALYYLSKEPQEQIAAGVLEVRSIDAVRNVVDVVYADLESAGRRIKTVWHRTIHDAGTGGTDVINGLLDGRKFAFPKSVFAVRDTVAMLTSDNPTAVVLDFFAGSGTTAHAVAMLNAEDGGSRQAILVTNNEVDPEQQATLRRAGNAPGDVLWEKQGIFQRATRPRIEAALMGVRADGSPVPPNLTNADGTQMSLGLTENVEFFELEYLDRDTISLGRAFASVAALLWLKAGGAGPRIERREGPWQIPEGGVYGVLFDVQAWRGFIEAASARSEVRHVFVVTDSISVFQQVATELPAGVAATILYEDYLTTFEINTGATS